MKLYIVHVGFYDDEIGIYELHSNFFVVAEDISDAKQKIKNKDVFIKRKMHIDGIQEIINVDGFDVIVKQNNANIINQSYDYDTIKNLNLVS